jgi:hypothetical protein
MGQTSGKIDREEDEKESVEPEIILDEKIVGIETATEAVTTEIATISEKKAVEEETKTVVEKIEEKKAVEEKKKVKTVAWKNNVLKLSARPVNNQSSLTRVVELYKKWISEINSTTINSVENYFKVFSLPSFLKGGDEKEESPLSSFDWRQALLQNIDYCCPKIILRNVRCSIIKRQSVKKSKNFNKCKMIVYLDSSIKEELIIIQFLQELEIKISQLAKSPSSNILKKENNDYVGDSTTTSYTFSILFPATVSSENINYEAAYDLMNSGQIFTSTISGTLARCDWISGAVLPRFVLTNVI